VIHVLVEVTDAAVGAEGMGTTAPLVFGARKGVVVDRRTAEAHQPDLLEVVATTSAIPQASPASQSDRPANARSRRGC